MGNQASAQRHIMIVDDDRTLVEEITRVLGDRDEFQVCPFMLGQTARAALQQENFDLVIANRYMPDIDGITLVREAQQRSPETVAILMSTYSVAEAKGLDAPPVAHHYLQKPFSIEDLTSVIDSIFPAPTWRNRKASLVLKVILGGDANVGKTSLIERYCTGSFDATRQMTIGVDFHLYDLEIETEPIRLVVWDLGGQERFSIARQAFYCGTKAIGLVFDASNRMSFYNLMRWWRETLEYLPDIPVVLLANKIDLPRQISSDEAWQIARAWGIPFFESSCVSGAGINEFFDALGREAWKHSQQPQLSTLMK